MDISNIKITVKCIDKMSKPLIDTMRKTFFTFLENEFKPSVEYLLS